MLKCVISQESLGGNLRKVCYKLEIMRSPTCNDFEMILAFFQAFLEGGGGGG